MSFFAIKELQRVGERHEDAAIHVIGAVDESIQQCICMVYILQEYPLSESNLQLCMLKL